MADPDRETGHDGLIPLRVPTNAFTETLRFAAEDSSTLAIKLMQELEAIQGSSPLESTPIPVESEIALDVQYRPAWDALMINLWPLFSARLTDESKSQPVFVLLEDSDGANLLNLSSDAQHSLASLISAALFPIREQVTTIDYDVVESPATVAAEYSPSHDTLRLTVIPLHRLLILAALDELREPTPGAIANTLLLDTHTTDRYLQVLLDCGVLRESKVYSYVTGHR